MIIDDSTDLTKLQHPGQRGCIARDWEAQPLARIPYARAVDHSAFRCESDEERKDLIRQRERANATNTELSLHYGFNPKFQDFSNWCWAASALMVYMFRRCQRGLPFIDFSIASLAAPCTNFQNIPSMRGRPWGVGGWCSQATQWLCEHGVAPVGVVKDTYMTRKEYTSEFKQAALENRIQGDEFDDLKPGDSRLMIDYLLKVGPCAAAFMWMKHAVSPWDAVILPNGELGVKCYNSGYLRDSNGFTILSGRRMIPDEIVGIRVTRS